MRPRGFVPVRSEIVWWLAKRYEKKERPFKRFGVVVSVSSDNKVAVVRYINIFKQGGGTAELGEYVGEVECSMLSPL